MSNDTGAADKTKKLPTTDTTHRPEAKPRARQVDAQEEPRQAPAQGRLATAPGAPISRPARRNGAR